MARIRVALVEDNWLFLEEMRVLLAASPLLEIVGAYMTRDEAIVGIIATEPEVALIDLELVGELSGVEVIRHVVAHGGPTECLVLTAYNDDDHLLPALRAGAVGYLVKDSASLPVIVQAIQDVIDGGAPMSMGIARRLLREFRDVPSSAAHPQGQGLTHREVQILELLATGLPTKQVAAAIHVSYETIRCHQKNIYRKLQAHSLVEALAVWRGAAERVGSSRGSRAEWVTDTTQ
jgi:DNA-binding NarL/FixJ family response regulator